VYVGKGAVIVVASLGLFLGWLIPASNLNNVYPALIAMMVTWAFAVGASCFVPMLLTGIWWKGTTERGAIAGMLVGLIGSVGIIFLNILQQLGTIGKEGAIGFLGSLTFPALFTFPAAVLTIIIVSKIDGNLPANVDQIWLRIHGTASERHEKQHGLDKVGSLFSSGGEKK
jgi:cation/acetate symporter